jgi:hypothetical protein
LIDFARPLAGQLSSDIKLVEVITVVQRKKLHTNSKENKKKISVKKGSAFLIPRFVKVIYYWALG